MANSVLICPWKWAVGLLLLVFLAVMVDSTLGWGTLLESWRTISTPWLLAAFVLFAFSHLLRALRIQLLLAEQLKSRFGGTVKLSAIHQFANNLLPMRLGEAVFPLLLNRYHQITWTNGLSKLIWLRLMDAIVMLSVVFLCFLLHLKPLLAAAMLVAAAAALYLLLWLGGRMRYLPIINKFLAPLTTNQPKSRSQLIELLTITLLAWGFKLSALMLLLKASTQVSAATAFAGTLGAELSSILPIHGFAGAGSFEAAFLAGSSLSALAWPGDALIAAAVNLHIFVFISTTLVMLFSLPFSLASKLPHRESLNANAKSC